MSEHPRTPAQAAIIPEDQHPIREQQLDREALKVLYRLRDAGFKGYLVGGGVRDLLLGKTPKDFDISTDARPGQLRKIFKNSRVIGRRFRLVQVFFHGGKVIEVSTLRSLSEYDEQSDEVLAANNSFGTLDEDAFRRDLTINALFYEIENHTVIDYVGGMADLQGGVIRTIGDPDLRFRHDPARMLRAVRHASRAGFSIDPRTLAAIERHAAELKVCPPSRLRDEVLKDLRSGMSRPWAELCMSTPLWRTLFPFMEEGEAAQVREDRALLLNILGEMDLLVRSGTGEQPLHLDERVLFAALLMPWAVRNFGLLPGPGEPIPPYHKQIQQLRDGVDEHFGTPFNVQRMAKERVCLLLQHLGTLHRAEATGRHPKALKAKSYYRDSKRLHTLYRLAQGQDDEGLAAEDFAPPPEAAQGTVKVISANESPATEPAESRSGHSHGRGDGGPAFSDQEGGVFGLKKCRK